MKLNEIKNRVNRAILLGEETLQSKNRDSSYTFVDSSLFYQFRSTALSVLKNIFGEPHPYYSEFFQKVKEESPFDVQYGIGILRSVKEEIDEGWILSLKELVSAEIFSDFIEMAQYLLTEGYKDAAAVLLGGVLEEHLRQLCRKNSISVTFIKDGMEVPKKADALNSELAAKTVYSKLDQKSVTSWLDLRNKAAHGKYSEYTKYQVEILQQGVTDFIVRTNS